MENEKRTYDGFIDTPEEIKKCLNCPKKECTNCLSKDKWGC